MASFSVLTAFWIIKTSQVKERSKEKKTEERSSFCSRALSLWEALFCSSCKITFQESHIRNRLGIADKSSAYSGIFHSYRELKMANFALCTVHAKMPCKCEFRTSPCKCEFRTMYCSCDFGAKSPLFCRLHRRSFLLCFFFM